MTGSKPRAARKPNELGAEGGALWREVAQQVSRDGFALDAQERRYLLDACREVDVAAELDRQWRDQGRPTTAKGAAGQVVVHPLVPELRQHREAAGRLLARLKLTVDEGAGGLYAVSNQNRDAAQARHRARGLA